MVREETKEENQSNEISIQNKGKNSNETSPHSSLSSPSKSTKNNKPKSSSKPASSSKVRVHFMAVGSAPLMKKYKFQIGADETVRYVMAFLHKILKLPATPNSSTGGDSNGSSPENNVNAGSLFLYCNAAFVPSPDERLGDLRDCFNVRGELVIHYSLQEAWG